jgi:uncharacterized delta-60 repeat protein
VTGAGKVDTTFGDGGVVRTGFGGTHAEALVLQPDGAIVVGGMAAAPGQPPFGWDTDFTLVRYHQDGTDTSFGTDGSVWTDFAGTEGRNEINAMAAQPSGRLVAAGETTSGTDDADFGLAAYQP